ncbi:hypothetical protein F9C07_10136 [Aspergillus flavus]|uniref:Uncharacterized protein n=1 Tax=Aspergillus flavus (strain ATCC 200026 / FGSC A1120 / IAM 13836 / NRRL 3357 / JCM 12722 / SRRC 167) TaxID=332952 RepID=A0A7U2QZZ3_ASPFN|nr:hypothetical protein F9C07_10136 [Aspergillus flavus]
MKSIHRYDSPAFVRDKFYVASSCDFFADYIVTSIVNNTQRRARMTLPYISPLELLAIQNVLEPMRDGLAASAPSMASPW